MQMNLKQLAVVLFFLLTLLATSWSLLHPGFFRVHDYVHATRIAEMLRALQDGHFPVRWTSNFGYGFGMPLFEFYAPLPYYVGTFFYWLGLDIITTIKLLYILCSAATYGGMYFLGKRLFGRAGAIVAAVAMTVAPYRAVNLYVRGALSEAWGIMALPWVLLGIVQVIRREKHGWLTLTLSLVVLFLSHNITTLLFVPVSAVFALGYWIVTKKAVAPGTITKATKKKKPAAVVKQASMVQVITQSIPVWLRMAGSYLLAIGLAAFYLFPALLEKDYTRVGAVFQGYFYYGHHFLYIRQFLTPNWGYGGSAGGPEDGISFFLGYGQLAAVGLAGVLLLLAAVHTFRKSKSALPNFWRVLGFWLLCMAIFGFSLFMTLFKAQAIWDMFKFMETVQFPWRWLAVAITFLGLIAGSVTLFLKSERLRYVYMTVLALIMLATNALYFRPEEYLADPVSFYYTDGANIRKTMSGILNDYIPKQMPEKLNPTEEGEVVRGQKDSKELTVQINRVHEKLIATSFSTERTLNLNIADFPGWTLYIDGQKVDRATSDFGNLAVTVPAGSHLVGAQFNDSPVRWWSDVVSVLSLGVFLFLLVQLRPSTMKDV